MKYFLDTDVCIDILRGRESDALSFFLTNSPETVQLPSLVEAELRLGAEKGGSEKNARAIEDFLSPFRIVPFDSDAAKHYARIRADLEERGKRIGPNDLIIAATALAHDACIVTNNVREYSRVPDLHAATFADVSTAG